MGTSSVKNSLAVSHSRASGRSMASLIAGAVSTLILVSLMAYGYINAENGVWRAVFFSLGVVLIFNYTLDRFLDRSKGKAEAAKDSA